MFEEACPSFPRVLQLNQSQVQLGDRLGVVSTLMTFLTLSLLCSFPFVPTTDFRCRYAVPVLRSLAISLLRRSAILLETGCFQTAKYVTCRERVALCALEMMRPISFQHVRIVLSTSGGFQFLSMSVLPRGFPRPLKWVVTDTRMLDESTRAEHVRDILTFT